MALNIEELFQLDEIKRFIREIDAKVPPQEEAVIIVGNTGDGKSSLITYLAEVPLSSKDDGSFGGFIIYADNPLDGVEISDGSVSKTSLPSRWEEYWDCPGFGDTRGPIQDIVNAFSIYKLAKNAKKLKVLVVVSEARIKESRQKSFLNLIRNLGKTFKNTDELVKGLCLVITKNETLNLEKMRNGLSKILKEQDDQKNFNSSQKEILTSLSSEGQIVFFNAPKKEGPISGEDRPLILESIKKISYLTHPNPSISIPSESENLVRGLAVKLNDDIEKLISKFCSEILDYIENLINNHSGTIKELRSSLEELSSQLKKISKESQQFEEFKEDLCQVLSIVKLFIKKKEIEDEFDKKNFQLDFIKLIKPDPFEFKGWYTSIDKSLQNINVLKHLPEMDNQGQVIIFKGLLIGTEDLNTAMEKLNDQEISEVNVYSLNGLFIDEDIIAPGINLTLISPKWYVIGGRIINLKGNPGPQHQQGKADDGIIESEEQINGKDGLPGLPGNSGGHFYAKGKSFFNISSLTINVSGGDGGQGQDGGNGAKGSDGSDNGKEIVKNRNELALISKKKISCEGVVDYLEKGIKFFFTFNDKFKEIYENYDPGQKGGNGGKGGMGGLKGESGSVIDEEFPSNEKPIILETNSKRGVNGKGGDPGSGGKNGPKFRGIYINEVVFSGIKGCKESNSESTEEITEETGIAATEGYEESNPESTEEIIEETGIAVMEGYEESNFESTEEIIEETGIAATEGYEESNSESTEEIIEETGIAATEGYEESNSGFIKEKIVGPAATVITGGIIAASKLAAKDLVYTSQIIVKEGVRQLVGVSKGWFCQHTSQVAAKEGIKQLFEVSKGWIWKKSSTLIASEGSKIIMQEVSKDIFKVLTKEAAEKVVKQGGKVVVKKVLKIGVTESGKHVVKVGTFTSITAGIAGMGVSLAIQVAVSPVSAYLSSYWEEEVHEVNNDLEYASEGNSSDLFNNYNIKNPFDLKPFNKEEKTTFYNQFKNQFYNQLKLRNLNDFRFITEFLEISIK